ncbi:ankyrin repeat domain-containing protein SOWAHA [Hypomesus transpacificus]|uniref:ankyrin repeat domain-containing protein SOWAHA n=1 Tax=Hypomesus transpacificus TaxID=137520 RepID=UPI001F07620D|nr:ankyrin repeat domain-containing protein SOWAHA [Hypomesus transpacificus]
MALTQECIVTFLLENGGKVKNSELVNNFKCQLNCSDPAEKTHNRDIFKKFVNSVAVVKQVNEVKFVVVKKRYQDFVKVGMKYSAHNSDLDDSFSSQTLSLSPTVSELSALVKYESVNISNLDIQNNNTCNSSNRNGNRLNNRADFQHTPVRMSNIGRVLRNGGSCKTSNEDPPTVIKVMNLSYDQVIKTGKTGPVFAIVAVKSPSRGDSPPARQDELNCIPTFSGLKTPVGSKFLIQMPVSLSEGDFMPLPNGPGRVGSEQSVSLWRERSQEETRAPGSPLLRRSRTCRAAEDQQGLGCVPLPPGAHRWMVTAASGLWGQIHGQLQQDSQLVTRKDFMSGYTALHWVAKSGHSEMVHTIMDVSRRTEVRVDVNARTHGGYTPLHLAALHGHAELMLLLLKLYGANANIRDNDGKKPLNYLGPGVSPELLQLLGGGAQAHGGREEEDRDMPRGINTLSRLFMQPHGTHRRKNKLLPGGVSPWD